MAESNLRSKKRKRLSYTTHHPLAGIFTRSKSQIYLHCTRSGRARLDSSRSDLDSVSKKPRNILDSSSGGGLSCTPVKDLRTRRVFSDGCGLRRANDEGNTTGKSTSGFAFKSCKGTAGDYLAYAKVIGDGGDMGKLDSGFCSQVVDLGCTLPRSNGVGVSSEESPGDAKVKGNDDDKLNKNPSLVMEKRRNNEECDISSGVCSLNDECVQTTPPDIEFLADTQSNGINRKTDGCIGEAFNGNTGSNRNGTNSRTKPVFTPRSRVKLFKAPGSFSYRRLLPHLTDISEDNSCALKTVLSSKTEKVQEEEKKFSSPHSQEVLLNESVKDNSPDRIYNIDSLSMLNSKSVECIKESSILFDSQKEVCTGRDSSVAPVSLVEEWSKPILDRGIIEFDIKISGKNQILNNSSYDLFPNKDKSISINSVGVIPIENGESETSHAEGSYDSHNMKPLNCSLPSIMDNCDSNKDNAICPSSEDTRQCNIEGPHKSDAGDSSMGKNLNLMNSNLSGGEQNGIFSTSEGNDNNEVEVLDHADNSNEESVQMAPPDADIYVKSEVIENHGDRVKCTLHSGDNDLGKTVDGNSNKYSSVNDKSINCNRRRNLVLKQCSRLKLLKTPGSMNYRRMLPFLIDATKDNSCDYEKCNCLKLQKCLEANLLSSSVVSICQEIPIGTSNGNCHYDGECRGGNSTALPIRTPVDSDDQEKNLSSYQHVNESPVPLNSQQKWEVHFEQNMSDTDRKLDTAPANVEIIDESKPLVTPLYSLLSSGSLPSEDAKLVSHASYEDACKNSLVQVPNGAKQIEPESFHQHLSQPGASFHLDMPVSVHKKGILKRTPRGCRGPCSCLNCSSFRLHAEKAFEFSRNQMQDAEEVAFDLIKELSYLRNLLEKSTSGADDYAAVCINQVKEACNRASEAEVVAQNRLGQMNLDLDIHCRLTCVQRPRVRFANYVEEKFIKESDSPSR